MMSATRLHDRLGQHCFSSFVAVISHERRVLGGRNHQRPFQLDISQLRSLLCFGCAVHQELQEAGPEGIALYIQHSAGAVTKDKQIGR